MTHDTVTSAGPASGCAHEQIESFLRTVMQGLMGRQDQDRAESSGKLGHPISLPSMTLWMAVLVAVLRGLRSQRAIWRLLAAGGWWKQPSYDIGDQAVYKRQKPRGMQALGSGLRASEFALSPVARASPASLPPTACALSLFWKPGCGSG